MCNLCVYVPMWLKKINTQKHLCETYVPMCLCVAACPAKRDGSKKLTYKALNTHFYSDRLCFKRKNYPLHTIRRKYLYISSPKKGAYSTARSPQQKQSA